MDILQMCTNPPEAGDSTAIFKHKRVYTNVELCKFVWPEGDDTRCHR